MATISDFVTNVSKSLKRAAAVAAQTFRAKDFKKQFTCAGRSFHFRYAASRGAPIGCFQLKKGGTAASVGPGDSTERTSVTANTNLVF